MNKSDLPEIKGPCIVLPDHKKNYTVDQVLALWDALSEKELYILVIKEEIKCYYRTIGGFIPENHIPDNIDEFRSKYCFKCADIEKYQAEHPEVLESESPLPELIRGKKPDTILRGIAAYYLKQSGKDNNEISTILYGDQKKEKITRDIQTGAKAFEHIKKIFRTKLT